jgi:hypothetical protein
MEKTSCEIWIAINEDGDYSVHTEGPSEAREQLIDDFGGACVRVIKITAKIAPPQIAEAEIDVADEAGETEQVETEAA